MCGICGYVGLEEPGLVAAMCRLLAHRGPDDSGTFSEAEVTLGHRRLSIIGVEGGRQPIYNEDGSLAIVYNGEIYNWAELRSRLEERGHRFSTNTDTEVIVHLYEEHGPECARHLEGMFAFAIWDRRRRELCLARDRLGIKPLFYHCREGRLLFASEIKALLLWPHTPRRVNLAALDSLLTFKHIPGEETLFEGIHKLLPGHCALFSLKERRLRTIRYWSVALNLSGASPLGVPEAVATTRQLLEAAVKSHLMSEVPLGATLSGGLDSSLIVGMMSRHLGGPVKTVSIGFEGEADEFEYSRLAAQTFRTDHHEFREPLEGIPGVLRRVIWHMEEPVTGALVPTYFLARKARELVTVILVGEGADEVFGGYVRLKALQGPWRYASPRLARWGYLRGLNTISAREKKGLYSWRLKESLNGHDPVATHLPCFHGPRAELLNRALQFEQESELPNHQLLRVDKLTMSHSVEARVPFLDHRLVEHVNGLPSRLKIRGFNEKYLLKLVAKDFGLPEPIWRRRKRGLSSPIGSWYGRGFAELAADYLSGGRLERRGYFQPGYVRRLFARSGGRHLLAYPEFKLNLLMMFEIWHQVFIDPPVFDLSAAAEFVADGGVGP